jgi:hypothetical protein
MLTACRQSQVLVLFLQQLARDRRPQPDGRGCCCAAMPPVDNEEYYEDEEYEEEYEDEEEEYEGASAGCSAALALITYRSALAARPPTAGCM